MTLYKIIINKKPPQRVASVVSILMSSGQDTNRHDDNLVRVPKQEPDFRVYSVWGVHPSYTLPHMVGLPEIFVHSTKLPYLTSLSSVVRQCKINKYDSK